MAIGLVAVILRSGLFFHVLHQPEVVLQPDSRMYVSLSQGLLENGTLSYPGALQAPSADRTPGYPAFLAAIFWSAGASLLTVIFIQILIDSVSCGLVFTLGERLWQGSGFLSGILAAVNLGMITYSHFILNDSLFLFFFLLFLLGFLKCIRQPSWTLSALLGVVLGAATMIRPVTMYLPLIVMPFLLAASMIQQRRRFLPAAGKALVVGIVFAFCLAPWMARNYAHYGRWSLSSQSGEHLLQYIVPFTWQYSKGIPFIEGMKQTSDAFKEKAAQANLDLKKASPFEVSDFQVSVALDCLKEEPKAALAKAWFFGMVKNLFAPSIIDFSYLLKIERPHFFYTEGATTMERAWNFLRGMKGWFGWAVIGSMVLLGASRVVQVWGLIHLFRRKPWESLFLVVIIGYFLMVSGPVGYAKYRLPFEPILIVFLAVGLKDLYERWIKSAGR
ncbi:MAG: glycosyltransferase family 39 protein [Desulfobacterota bacterium]|nr:glycosyltransferase family 39 protein [Thermodesulfobacteriota bacterium]